MSLFDKFRKASTETEPFAVTYEHTFQTALALQKQGSKESARELFKRVAEGVPLDRASCFELGLSYFGEDCAQSANWFGKVLGRSEENDELSIHAIAFLAQCFKKLGDRKQAVTCLQALHTLRPDFAQRLAEDMGLLNG